MTPHETSLIDKFRSGQGRVGIVGLGYVGLPLALEFVNAGFAVAGVDINHSRVERLKEGICHVEDVSNETLRSALGNGLSVHSDYKALAGVDAVSICVPTPLRKTKDPDLSYIVDALEKLLPQLHAGMLVVLESTTYPGTTREMFTPRLAELGFEIGKDIFVAFSPERVDPGNKQYTTKTTPKVVGGLTAACTRVASEFYRKAVDRVVPMATSEEAEMVKLLENTFRAVNIALVNELLLMSDRMKIDIWNVIGAAATKPFGFMPFYPGPGIGGHCIPLDPAYLSWKAKTYDFYNRFIEMASDINGNMPRFVVQRAATLLNRSKKPLNGSRILILGVAYKPNVSDVRESPALEVLKLLEVEGAVLDYHDPYVPDIAEGSLKHVSVDLQKIQADAYDLGILVTHHAKLDRKRALQSCQKILDCRNFFADEAFSDKVEKL